MCRLNRILFDPEEVEYGDTNGKMRVVLPDDDYRTLHVARILGAINGDTVRAGLVALDERKEGYLTDAAVTEWLSDTHTSPLKNGDPPGSLIFHLESLRAISHRESRIPVSLILALPRPLQLGRLLPMISQLGVDHLVLTSARKVPRGYFGSHLLREPVKLRDRLIEGLCQAGDVRLPKVDIVPNNLRSFLDNDLDDLFPLADFARVIAHPQRGENSAAELRMHNVEFPSKASRVVIAVGPEGGWMEPDELQHFQRRGFQQITLGTRVLRSDVAVVSLLTLAHDLCSRRASLLHDP